MVFSATNLPRIGGWPIVCRRRVLRSFVVLLCTFIVIGATSAHAEQLRLQFAWGGSKPVDWRGRVTVEGGRFSNPRYLGDEVDVVESLSLRPNAIEIHSASPRTYQAVEVTLDAPATAKVLVEFLMGESQTPKVLDLAVEDLVARDFNGPLDDLENRLLIRRVPGDSLRVSMVDEHLVFAPKQQWVIDVVPHRPRLPNSNRARLQLRLTRAGSEQVLWRTDRVLGKDDLGVYEAVRAIQVPVPAKEGVYDLAVRMSTRNLNLLLPTSNSSVERRIQFVVLSERSPQAVGDNTQWRRAISFDPAEPRWWERLGRLPRFEQFSINPMRMRGKGDAQSETLDGQPVSRLNGGAWQAYPLPVSHVGEPHLLEVAYPTGVPHSLGVSVVEPMRDGSLDLKLQDAAVLVSEPIWDPQNRVCRMVFWPKTRMPYVWLTNLAADKPAYFGRIQVWDGPRRLPSAPARPDPQAGRLVYAQLDQPDFAEFFNAQGAAVKESERTLKDWRTFYAGCDRLVQYLKHSGLSGVRLNCYGEGGAICPIPGGCATAKYDSGAYFSSGQDLHQKDVVEMLLRMFEREGLGLVVGLRFDSALPELESQLSDAQSSQGIRLVEPNADSTSGPRYNILDQRVQSEMVRIVRYFADRYGHHRSFAGIALQLDENSVGHVGSSSSGWDSVTLQRFQQEHAPQIRQVTGGGSLEPAMVVAGPLRDVWLQWRADQIAGFYQTLVAATQRTRPDAEFRLDLSRLVECPDVSLGCRPMLPRQTDIAAVMVTKGLDLYKLAAVGAMIDRPWLDEPMRPIVERGKYQVWTQDETWSRLAKQSVGNGAILRPATYEVTATDIRASGIFDGESMAQRKHQRVDSDSSALQMLSASLVNDDAATIYIGGSRLPNLMSPATQDWLHSFQRLPVGKFKPFDSSTGRPVTVCTLQHAGRTYVYAINDSPWTAKATVRFQAADGCRFASLDRDASKSQWLLPSANANIPAGEFSWQRELPPYGLAVGFLTDPDAVATSVQSSLPDGVVSVLQGRYADVAARLTGLKRPKPYEVITNEGFDAAPDPVGVPGWQWPREPNVTVERDNKVFHSGLASLRLESQQPVTWVRSDPLPAPATGRLALQAMIKFDTSVPSAPLRIALEGVHNDRPYYRYAQVLPPTKDATQSSVPVVGPDGNTTPTDWMPFMLQVNDLPTEGLEQLRVRFDLMGAGKVWVDDLRMFDLVFTADEQMQLSRIVSLADYHLREGDLAACAHTLDQYWPQYLIQFATPETLRVADTPKASVPVTPRSQSPTFLGRVRELIPSLLR